MHFITKNDVASILNVKTAYVTQLCQENAIPFYRLGRKTIRFDETEINNWIKGHKEKTIIRPQSLSRVEHAGR